MEIFRTPKLAMQSRRLPSVRLECLSFPPSLCMGSYIITTFWGYKFGKVFDFICVRHGYILTIRDLTKKVPSNCEGHSELMTHEDEASLDLTTPITGYTRSLHLRHSWDSRCYIASPYLTTSSLAPL